MVKKGKISEVGQVLVPTSYLDYVDDYFCSVCVVMGSELNCIYTSSGLHSESDGTRGEKQCWILER